MHLSFHGAVRGVTGSCHLLRVQNEAGEKVQLLFDCGMFQGQQLCGTKNQEAFGFDPEDIDAVFITHPHADHTGRLPKLVKEGFSGPIYMLDPAVGLTKLVLEDAFHIMKEDAEKCGSSVLYDLLDLQKALGLFKGVGFHEEIEVSPGVQVMFHDAGHILGSGFVRVKAEGKTIVFSGDIGNDDVPILPETEAIHSANYVVTESTYGNRRHEDVSERMEKLRDAILKCAREKSVLLIPAFSIERTQELLYAIDQLFAQDLKVNVPIYLDSPMAIRATELYRHFKNYLHFDASILDQPDRDFFSFKNLHETLPRDASRHINDVPPPKIIIAGSGMMSGGRIMHHLKRYLHIPSTQLLVIGYQAHGTIGRAILDGAKTVTIHGDEIPVKAQVQKIGAFSAHGDVDKLTRWLHPEDGEMPKKVFLVHGDPEAKQAFAKHLRSELQTEIIIPELQQEFEL